MGMVSLGESMLKTMSALATQVSKNYPYMGSPQIQGTQCVKRRREWAVPVGARNARHGHDSMWGRLAERVGPQASGATIHAPHQRRPGFRTAPSCLGRQSTSPPPYAEGHPVGQTRPKCMMQPWPRINGDPQASFTPSMMRALRSS